VFLLNERSRKLAAFHGDTKLFSPLTSIQKAQQLSLCGKNMAPIFIAINTRNWADLPISGKFGALQTEGKEIFFYTKACPRKFSRNVLAWALLPYARRLCRSSMYAHYWTGSGRKQKGRWSAVSWACSSFDYSCDWSGAYYI